MTKTLAQAILDEIERHTLAREPITLTAIEGVVARYTKPPMYILDTASGERVPCVSRDEAISAEQLRDMIKPGAVPRKPEIERIYPRWGVSVDWQG